MDLFCGFWYQSETFRYLVGTAFKFIRSLNFFLPGQGLLMHFLVSLLGPGQYLPPYAGLGLLQ